MKAKQLRDSIFQMAIQGKLVPQDPNDEPASELLKKIKAEKEQLIKDKKIKKDKNESTIFRGKDGLFYETIGNETKCIQEEIPFEIPDSWEWCRLCDIAFTMTGTTPPTSNEEYFGNFYHFIKPADIYNNTISFRDDGLSEIGATYSRIAPKDSILMVCIGGSIGKSAITSVDVCFNQQINSATMIGNICNYKFINHIFNSIFFQRNVITNASGTATPIIKKSAWELLLLPLPPLSEQKRIVEEIEKLLPLVDDYGKNEEALSKLQKEFPNRLRKSILQEAIQGKLVPQDPNDEPASELLKKIKAEKEQLIKDKKIKKDKNESTIFRGKDGLFYETIGNETKCIQEEIPFEIPDSWEWCRLGNIITITSGKALPSSKMIDGNVPVYGGNGITGYHNTSIIHEETIVIGRVGFYCGSVHLTSKECWITDNAFITDFPKQFMDLKFLIHLLRFLKLGEDYNATAQPVVSGKKIYPLLCAIPPLSEQKRIVDEIEKIYSKIALFDK